MTDWRPQPLFSDRHDAAISGSIKAKDVAAIMVEAEK
jgi:hypothetical protein